MRRRAIRAALAAWLAIGAAVGARAQETPRPPVTTRLTWDEFYLFAAFEVTDSDVSGTSRAPMSTPERDDSVGVYLRTPAGSHAMLVSAAGGFTFQRFDAEKKAFVPQPLFSIKFGVTVQGTLNRSDDRDRGYTVEMAIPWEALGVDAKTLDPARAPFGIALTARQRLQDAAGRFPASADLADPSTWAPLALEGAAPPAAPRVPRDGRPPLIDGELRPGEWTGEPVRFDGPAAPEALPAAPTPAAEPVAVPMLRFDQPWSGADRVLFARYVPTYQADIGKGVANRNVFTPAGTIGLRDQPTLGIGPWFSSDRVGWHRGEMAAIRRAGFEVALTQGGGPDVPTAALDEKALTVLTAALKEMAEERIPAPRLALWLDTRLLAASPDAKPDLAAETGRALLYRAIRRWMQLVPPELRACLPLPSSAGDGVLACPVFLSEAAPFANPNDPGWGDDLRKRFAAEFGAAMEGATLVFVGGPGFDPAAHLAASLPIGPGRGTGPLALSVVQPGSETPLAPRKGGDTYKAHWEAALDAGAAWILVDSWNDFVRGTEIAPSRQYGERYADATRLFALRAVAGRPAGVRIASVDVPRKLRPGQVVPVNVRLQNIGLAPLKPDESGAVGYRWLQDGKTIGEGPLKIRLSEPLIGSQSATVRIGVAAVATGADGKPSPLPAGNYLLQFEATSPPGSPPDAPVGRRTVPVTIAPDIPDAVQFAGTTASSMWMSGGSYAVVARLRWLGAEALPAGDAQLIWQVVTANGRTVLASGAAPLDRPLRPGLWETARATVRLTGADSQPLPPAVPEFHAQTPDETKHFYRLRWLLSRASSAAPVAGSYEENIAVYPADDEARIVPPADLPDELPADKLVAVHLTVINRGVLRWIKGPYFVTYRWCYADGFTSRQVDGDRVRVPIAAPYANAAIPQEVAPGEAVPITMTVRAPEREGRYILQFVVLRQPGGYLDSAAVTRTGDIAMAPVTVRGGRLSLLDLTPLFDTDAVAPETAPADGDLDGQGATFPAEWFAADAFGLNQAPPADPKRKPLPYPSGYFEDVTSEAARAISFRYGPTAPGAKNALTCAGQTIPTPRGRYVALHLVAAAVGPEDRPLTLTLRYADGSVQTQTRPIGDWLRPPTEAEATALGAPRKRLPAGDQPGPIFLRHSVVAVDVGKELAAVQLPVDPKLKLFAATLER